MNSGVHAAEGPGAEADAVEAKEATASDDCTRRFLELIFGDAGIRELRALGVVRSHYPYKNEHIETGYFRADQLDEVQECIDHLRGDLKGSVLAPNSLLQHVSGAYYTLNPVKPAAYGRAPGKMVSAKQGQSTTDSDISHRTTLLIDIDAPREVNGVPATNEEKEQAIDLSRRVRAFLNDSGWPAPIEVDSGNGIQLLYRVDLPADDNNLVENVLAGLATQFPSEGAKIDQSVHNASRIARLPGTWNRKAHHVDDRPHRLARVVELPAAFQPVPVDLLRELADLAPKAPPPGSSTRPRPGATRSSSEFGEAVERWNADHPQAWPTASSPCPICESPDGFKSSTGNDSRWCCFSSRHVDLAARAGRDSAIGRPGRSCYTGDSLDVGAWTSKRSRKQVLVDDGYLPEHSARARRKACPQPESEPLDKPAVLVPGEHDGQRVGTDQFVRDVLAHLPLGAVYRRGDVLGELVGQPGRLRFLQTVEHRLRAIVDGNMQLEATEWDEDAGEFQVRYRPCSRDLASTVVASAHVFPGVRNLTALVRYPVLTTEWTPVTPGWNEASGIYYDEPADLVGLQPRAEGALDLLDDIVVDFPFRDEAARHNAFGMLLTALCAPAIHGNIPLHLVFSSLERTGKGLLIDTLLGIVALGEDGVPTMQLGRTEEEREKRITSAIIEGATITHFDNLPAEVLLDSPSLASLATSRVWRGRLLGQSKIIQLPNTLIPVFSGNNPKSTGELTKRTVPIALQPRDDRPEERRDFKHADVRAYARQRRRMLLEAALGMVLAWRDAGCPPPPASLRMGGFEDWVRVVGGILHYAGATSWLTNYSAWVKTGDEFSADAAVLVEHWWQAHRDAQMKPSDILAMVEELGVFPQVTAGPPNGATIRLSRQLLGPLENRPIAGRVMKRRAKGNASLYWLTEAAS